MVDLPDRYHPSWPATVPPVPQARRVPRNRPLTPAEVEEAIRDALNVLEDSVEDLEARSVSAAIAESEYRVRRARALLDSTRKTDTQREAAAIVATDSLLLARNVSAALRDSAQEAVRVRRSELEALRTLAASARATETGRG